MGLRERTVRYKVASLMALVGMAASPLGVWASRRIPNAPLVLLLAGALAVVSYRMLKEARSGDADPEKRKPALATACRLDSSTGKFQWTALAHSRSAVSSPACCQDC